MRPRATTTLAVHAAASDCQTSAWRSLRVQLGSSRHWQFTVHRCSAFRLVGTAITNSWCGMGKRLIKTRYAHGADCLAGAQDRQLYGLAMFGFDMPAALPCPDRFCTPDMVGGMVILPSMSYLVQYHHLHGDVASSGCLV
jgi:hypothetical protein